MNIFGAFICVNISGTWTFLSFYPHAVCKPWLIPHRQQKHTKTKQVLIPGQTDAHRFEKRYVTEFESVNTQPWTTALIRNTKVTTLTFSRTSCNILQRHAASYSVKQPFVCLLLDLGRKKESSLAFLYACPCSGRGLRACQAGRPLLLCLKGK